MAVNTTIKQLGPILLLLLAGCDRSFRVVQPTFSEALSLENVQSRLSLPDSPQRRALIYKLDLKDTVSNEPCYEIGRVDRRDLWLQGMDNLISLEVDAPGCLYKFVVMFESGIDSSLFVGTIPLWQQFSTPSYHVEALFPNGVPGILVSGLTVDEGTGFNQQNMQIFRIIDNKLRIVFDEPERMRTAIPFKSRCCPVQWKDSQTSTFSVDHQQDGSTFILEKRAITVNGQTVTQYKSYGWRDRLQIFISTGSAPQLK